MSQMDIRTPRRKDQPIAVKVKDKMLWVTLLDGRVIGTPLGWYESLSNASAEEISHFELSYDGIHWPDLDEDLSVRGMLSGVTGPERTDEEWEERFAGLGFDPDIMLADEDYIDELQVDMTTAEVAETYGITDATVRQTIARGVIPARKSGGVWLIRRIDAEDRWGRSIGHTQQSEAAPD